ncbi:M24 family metallopeptidase [Cecembia calidifontis]|uniref:Xaa-Pro dipeptidase n=1 Tax=Cecembia calidifontis TaxID=1187080 RepID=A0A4V2F6C6_9BACT|nr:Xaa-Pro peptidase family protein [Cecembia calidifontis]RZS95849.1 Xaa-Pro dipeptidase [Cecembia calidifontis]
MGTSEAVKSDGIFYFSENHTAMKLKRRSFVKWVSLSPALAMPAFACSRPEKQDSKSTSKPVQPLNLSIEPISRDERLARLAKAQQLMQEQKIDALFLEPGTSMKYFLDFDFFLSERMVAAVIPAKGDIAYICPRFEQDKVEELVKFGNKVLTWNEHQSPYALTAKLLRDLGTPNQKVAIEERCRFFLYDGIKNETSRINFVNGDGVTAGCRMYKSPAEIALMQAANTATLEAYKILFNSLEEGMTQYDFRDIASEAHSKLGFRGSIGANFGEWSAFPHGSSKIQKLKPGDIVLADGGCTVEGYQSDISRTIVFGDYNDRQKEVWEVVKEAQSAAFELAKQAGATCEQMDAAARSVIDKAGFGPDYKYFSHRLGHGIGMDGHEWTNLVRGNSTPLQAGMCFSNEPGIYIVGEFGVRLEDCFYMTENGPQYFTQPSPAIDKPFA